MTINPVFVNELRQSAFRRRSRLIVGALLAAGMLLAALAQIGGLRNLIVFAPVVLQPLVVPAIASGAFAKEYEQQTWMDLYLTRLTNAQVVWGKFGAYFVQTAISLLAFMPAIVLMLLGEYSHRLSDLRYEVVPIHLQFAAVVTTFWYLLKLLLSSCLYIALTMVCSRYSPNRRTALIWSYVAMALYTGFGWINWMLVGSLDYQQHAMDQNRSGPYPGNQTIELTNPGFMESLHLLFCSILGGGSFFLMWISLSEQRGYRGGSGEATARAWQPIAARTSWPADRGS